MPARNPGKTAFMVIIGLAALTGVLFYIFAGIAMPKPTDEAPAGQELLPPAIPSSNASSQQNDTPLQRQSKS